MTNTVWHEKIIEEKSKPKNVLIEWVDEEREKQKNKERRKRKKKQEKMVFSQHAEVEDGALW